MANIIEITDFAAPELDIYARYSEVQLLRINEPKPGIFIAESPKVVERALDAGYEPISMLVEHKHIETQAKELIARCGDIPVYTAEYDVLTKLTGFALTRGMLCAMRKFAAIRGGSLFWKMSSIPPMLARFFVRQRHYTWMRCF